MSGAVHAGAAGFDERPPTYVADEIEIDFSGCRPRSWWYADEMVLRPPPEWIWRPYIPKGRLVLLDGSEGIGKGLFTVYLACLVTEQGGTVLWLPAEDDPEEDIFRRLLAAGYQPQSSASIAFAVRSFSFPEHIIDLEDAIKLSDARMVILDPGRSFLGAPDGLRGMNYSDEAFIRPGLEALNKLAKRTGATIVFVHHWNKNTATTVQYRQGGSSAFAQVVRHRLTMAWVGPSDGGSGAFEVSKSNISSTGHLCSFSKPAVPELQSARFELGAAVPDTTLDDWLRAASTHGQPRVLTVEEFIAELTSEYVVGDRLPAARDLAPRLRCPRESVVALYCEAVKLGFVEKTGRGYLLAEGASEPASQIP